MTDTTDYEALRSSDDRDHGRGPKIRGWHVFIAMVAFFAVIFAVNIVFISVALGTFRGEEVERSYVQGLAYNEVLAERRAQAELGWTAAVNLDGDTLILEVTDSEGAPVGRLPLQAALRHPADGDLDRTLDFAQREPGVYVADVSGLPEGRWRFEAEARGDTPFAMERELWRR